MKTLELVQLAKAKHKEAFSAIPDKRSVAMVNAVLAELGARIRESKEPVAVGGFGKFMIREKMVAKDGEEVSRRRVAFRAAPLKAAGPGKNAAGAAGKKPGAARKAGAAKKAAGAAAKKSAGAAKSAPRREADNDSE
jgi:nucleoid DNA-binding protein